MYSLCALCINPLYCLVLNGLLYLHFTHCIPFALFVLTLCALCVKLPFVFVLKHPLHSLCSLCINLCALCVKWPFVFVFHPLYSLCVLCALTFVPFVLNGL